VRGAATTLGALALVVVLAACGSSGGGTAGADRPHTPATLEIVDPTPNATTGADTTVRLALAHATLAPGTQISGGAQPRTGHIHLSVDGQLYSMTDSLTQEIRALTPGVHTVQAEFVAADHLPFANRVVAAVSFEVSG
jgi:hypothetical protein